jgi:hypothetical protein
MGANAILGISLACAKAGAGKRGVPLYQVAFLVIYLVYMCVYVCVYVCACACVRLCVCIYVTDTHNSLTNISTPVSCISISQTWLATKT